MAKIFKISGYLVDPNGQYTADHVEDSIDVEQKYRFERIKED